jgi:hypothetical protein
MSDNWTGEITLEQGLFGDPDLGEDFDMREALLETAERHFPDQGWRYVEDPEGNAYVCRDDNEAESWDLDGATRVAVEVAAAVGYRLRHRGSAHVAVQAADGDFVVVDATVAFQDGFTMPFLYKEEHEEE